MESDTVSRWYGSVLVLLNILLVSDLAINCVSPLLYFNNTVQLVLYVLQDTCIVMELIVLFLTFFATYVFRAGLISLLVYKFKTTIIATCVYFGLSLMYHVTSLTAQWGSPYSYNWNSLTTGLYVVQRCFSALYYHLYKRSILSLGDPRYYQDSPWLRAELAKRQ